jgi:hypothetical protein
VPHKPLPGNELFIAVFVIAVIFSLCLVDLQAWKDQAGGYLSETALLNATVIAQSIAVKYQQTYPVSPYKHLAT